MKHKTTKTVLIVSLAAFAMGGICLGAGIAMGGSPSFYYDKDGIHVLENAKELETSDYVLEKTVSDSIKNLEISLYDANLELVSGTGWEVEYVLSGERYEPEFSMENETLLIKENENYRSDRYWCVFDGFWGSTSYERQVSPYVKITVPDFAVLDKADLSVQYGNISIEKALRAEKLEVTSESGEMHMDGWVGTSLTCEMDYGAFVAGALSGEEIMIENYNGNVKMSGLDAENAVIDMEYGDLETRVGAVHSLDVEAQNGEVHLKLEKPMSEYGVSLHTKYGTIRTSQGIVKDQDEEADQDYIELKDERAAIHVYSENGDIMIRD
ncbi:MAG: DUF4097 family beta strand repeat protein [Lachnospiraceae bacterium]|nr:DUF4097 family beta strand repeat protein [Lachnospiraceae bacterium]